VTSSGSDCDTEWDISISSVSDSDQKEIEKEDSYGMTGSLIVDRKDKNCTDGKDDVLFFHHHSPKNHRKAKSSGENVENILENYDACYLPHISSGEVFCNYEKNNIFEKKINGEKGFSFGKHFSSHSAPPLSTKFDDNSYCLSSWNKHINKKHHPKDDCSDIFQSFYKKHSSLKYFKSSKQFSKEDLNFKRDFNKNLPLKLEGTGVCLLDCDNNCANADKNDISFESSPLSYSSVPSSVSSSPLHIMNSEDFNQKKSKILSELENRRSIEQLIRQGVIDGFIISSSNCIFV
jgi:hypothetical protein